MKTGFLILNFNSWELAKILALKVSAFNCIDKVVVIDNCSTNDSFRQLKELESYGIVIYSSEKNGGYSYGNNYGMQVLYELGMDFAIVSNPDVDIEEYDLNKLIGCLANSNYSLVTGVEYDIDRMISEPVIWKLSSYTDDLLDCFYFGKKMLKHGIELNSNVDVQDIEIFKGSFFVTKINDFIEVGGFDEGVFLFCEERILSKKYHNAGKKMGLVTSTKYYHNHSYSINKEYKNQYSQISLLYKSRYFYNKKYNKLGLIRLALLKVCMKISLVEYRLIGYIRGR